MAFQHDLSMELQEAILMPPPQSIDPTPFNPKAEYYDALIRLSHENPYNYWPPFKHINRLPDGQWECEVTMGVFRSGGTVEHTRKVASHTVEDAIEMAASFLYHDLLLDFVDDQKSNEATATVAPPARAQIGVWKVEHPGKKMTKTEQGKLHKEESSREKQAKKKEKDNDVETKRREKKLKAQQRVRETMLDKISLRERRLERKLECWNARNQKLQSTREPTVIADDSDVVKVRNDLMSWRGKLEDFERGCEVENTQNPHHLTLGEQELMENLNHIQDNGIGACGSSSRQPEIDPSNSSDPAHFDFNGNFTQSSTKTQNFQSGTLSTLPTVNTSHSNPTQFNYGSSSTQSTPKTQNIQSGTLTAPPMVNIGHCNPTSTIFSNNSNQASPNTWDFQSTIQSNSQTLDTQSNQAIPSTWDFQNSAITSHPAVNPSYSQESAPTGMANIISDWSGENLFTTAPYNDIQAYSPIYMVDIAHDGEIDEVSEFASPSDVFDLPYPGTPAPQNSDKEFALFCSAFDRME